MASKTEILLDTSVLINFARIGRIDLLARRPRCVFLVTDHVRAEVLEHYREQFEAVDAAVESGILTELAVTGAGELEDFGKLVAMKSLGIGECSAIAVAKHRSMALALDDVPARKKAVKFHSGLRLLGTEDLMVALVKENVLSIQEADSIKHDWEANHRFKLMFGSFAERV